MAKKTQNTKTDGTKGTLSDKKELFLKALKNNLGNVSASCSAVNIGRQTYYNWIEADKEFEQSCIDAEESLLDLAENRLLEKIDKYDTTSIIFFLKTKGRKRGYNESTQLELVKPISEITFDEI